MLCPGIVLELQREQQRINVTEKRKNIFWQGQCNKMTIIDNFDRVVGVA